MPTKDLTEFDKIKTRLLSYKINGMKSSLAMQEQVLADIRNLKEIGEQVRSEAEFNKKLEQREKALELVNLIDKAPDKNWFPKLINSVLKKQRVVLFLCYLL